jgi:hypothetical protein
LVRALGSRILVGALGSRIPHTRTTARRVVDWRRGESRIAQASTATKRPGDSTLILRADGSSDARSEVPRPATAVSGSGGDRDVPRAGRRRAAATHGSRGRARAKAPRQGRRACRRTARCRRSVDRLDKVLDRLASDRPVRGRSTSPRPIDQSAADRPVRVRSHSPPPIALSAPDRAVGHIWTGVGGSLFTRRPQQSASDSRSPRPIALSDRHRPETESVRGSRRTGT